MINSSKYLSREYIQKEFIRKSTKVKQYIYKTIDDVVFKERHTAVTSCNR